jgi:hypothetical protein
MPEAASSACLRQWPYSVCPASVRHFPTAAGAAGSWGSAIRIGHRIKRIIRVVAVLDAGQLRMHLIRGIRSALLGDLALAGDFADEPQPGLNLVRRQIVEMVFEFESALICRPHVIEHHPQRGDAGRRDHRLPSC